MQNSFDKYLQYSATDFALDDDFVNWTLFPNDENDTLWNEYITKVPDQKKNIEAARNIILSFDTSAEKIPDDIKNRVWQSVISKADNGRIVKMKPRRVWMVAASALIILASGILYFYVNKNQSHLDSGNVVKNAVLKNDIAPGGNKAILTLANGSTIVLDSAQNGTLTQQGSAKVVKLDDGKLVYREDENSSAVAIQYNTITTPRGGQYQLILADGSKVWLNAASSIRFPTAFTGKEREVQITGEAYFEVAHNADMPFHVKVNNMDVAVLGTHFNINAYNDEGVMKTTLLEGSVKVSEGNENVLIKPGEQAQIKKSSDKIIVKKDVDMEEVVAWKNGKFIFQDADIRSIMRQLERWYNITTVSYEGNVTNEEFVGVISRDVNVSQILSMLQSTGTVKFEVEGRKIIVK
ncbi:MAG: FecR domain-containing protein [Ginsengibacter sp.]